NLEREGSNIRGLGRHLERGLQGLISTFQDENEGVSGLDAQTQRVFAFRNRLISHYHVKRGLYGSNGTPYVGVHSFAKRCFRLHPLVSRFVEVHGFVDERQLPSSLNLQAVGEVLGRGSGVMRRRRRER